MRRYSLVIGLLAVITAMAILQLGTLNADATSATISSQSNPMNRPATVGGALMVPMDNTLLAKDKGDDKDSDGDKKVGESEKKDEKPDLRTVDWSKASSVKKGNGNGNGGGEDKDDGDGEDEDKEAKDKEDDEGGGFDRLWDVVSNG